jgi:hypothetical protein
MNFSPLNRTAEPLYISRAMLKQKPKPPTLDHFGPDSISLFQGSRTFPVSLNIAHSASVKGTVCCLLWVALPSTLNCIYCSVCKCHYYCCCYYYYYCCHWTITFSYLCHDLHFYELWTMNQLWIIKTWNVHSINVPTSIYFLSLYYGWHDYTIWMLVCMYVMYLCVCICVYVCMCEVCKDSSGPCTAIFKICRALYLNGYCLNGKLQYVCLPLFLYMRLCCLFRFVSLLVPIL